MPTINELKELETSGTPLFLFECTLRTGDVQRWSTHKAIVDGVTYNPRVLRHSAFELRSSADDATDGMGKLTLTLANADGDLSPIDRAIGWKGSQIQVRFLFYDLVNGIVASEDQVVFRGVANPIEESNDSTLRLSFINRLNLQRVYLPDTRIQKRCPWRFPSTDAQRTEALDGGSETVYGPFFRCGYSAGMDGGVGNLGGATPFTSCDFTRTQCQERGMFDKDSAGNVTRRFGGMEFMPPSIQVRAYGEKGSHNSVPVDNEAVYNDFVPLIYGTAWYLPPVIFARNDGNLTRMEVLLGAGEMDAVVKVIVNGIEVPAGVAGTNMTASGWYNPVTMGSRPGGFDSNFSDSSGNPLGDPYGSIAVLSVVVPNRINNGASLPRIEVLARGMLLSRFDSAGADLGRSFSNNSAWVLLDILRRSGWKLSELDLASFATAADISGSLTPVVDLNGNQTLAPRFQCNLVLTARRSAADVVRGIRNAASLFLRFNTAGLLSVGVEGTIAEQQPSSIDGSNSQETLDGGWPSYEFGDNHFSGIARKASGEPSVRVWARNSADSPNRYTVEFQDEFNEYQQDSLSLVDLDDSLQSGQEITASLTALGLPNFDQATRIITLQLNKSLRGNTYIDFETSVRAVKIRPGDIVTFTYAKEGWTRQPFRITRIAPGANYRTAAITAQLHDDSWYSAGGEGGAGSGRQPGYRVGLPRPLVVAPNDADGYGGFDIAENTENSSDGSAVTTLTVSFPPPRAAATTAGIPLVGLSPEISSQGGAIGGNQELYYAVTAAGSDDLESALSFVVHAHVPAGTDTNQVKLLNISFPAGTASFHVYRGASPAQLLRTASSVPLADSYTDSGDLVTAVGPPDANFDHANFYWRLERQPSQQATISAPLAVGNSELNMPPGDYAGTIVRINAGKGMGQERLATLNTATTLTVNRAWDIQPDTTSTFLVVDANWQYGASGPLSPISFEVPNRDGATIEISGRAANIRNEEASYETSPITRWRIQGGGGSLLKDLDVAPEPSFGLALSGQGSLEVSAIGFGSFANTASVVAGTLTLFYWNETGNVNLSNIQAASSESTTVTLTAHLSCAPGDILQVESELMSVLSIDSTGNTITVVRGALETTAAGHGEGTAAYLLQKKTFIMPFAEHLFGSDASGSFSYPVRLPEVRVAAAELFVTNSRGNSGVTRQAYTSTGDLGLRTLSGGQISIQVEGKLGVQAGAAPVVVMEDSRSVRDIFAVVRTAPTDAPIQLQVTQNGAPYCLLTVPAQANISEAVGGFALGPLLSGAQIGLDILSVSSDPTAQPGSDLTVTVRL